MVLEIELKTDFKLQRW